MAVECFAILELDEHGVALRRVEKPEGQLHEVNRNVRSPSISYLGRSAAKEAYHLECVVRSSAVCGLDGLVGSLDDAESELGS